MEPTIFWSKSSICITTIYLLWYSPVNSYEPFTKLWSVELLNALKKKKKKKILCLFLMRLSALSRKSMLTILTFSASCLHVNFTNANPLDRLQKDRKKIIIKAALETITYHNIKTVGLKQKKIPCIWLVWHKYIPHKSHRRKYIFYFIFFHLHIWLINRSKVKSYKKWIFLVR